MTEIPESEETKMARKHLVSCISKALNQGKHPMVGVSVYDTAKAVGDAMAALIEEKYVDMLNAMSDLLANQPRNP